ncbi:MAG: mechanosensitive ion channel [Tepidimonas sp.]|uniref:mechanosensitive ion channel family protein n=1 Tax=Tepidimonas sp. TaxID=2002775 RepID=UPI00259E4923|nr:mechanosensitive ion channel domain-containing protein [Tepidimonas sp.]MDM7455845.1 mechanosensitive ion channel [Tepidimonas sp.]
METMNQTLTWMGDPMIALYHRLAALSPNLAGALALLLVGYVLGKIAAAVIRRLLVRLGADRLAESSGLARLTRQWGLERPLSALVGSLAFAFILLAFAISAADAIGLAAAGQAVTQVMLFLPKFVAAMAVLVLGLMAAGWLSELVRRAADGAGVEYAPSLSRITMGVLSALVVLLAIDQLDIRIVLLQEIIGIVLAALGVAVALSLGLGTRTLSGEIVSGVYVRDWLREGDRIEWNGLQATVREVGTLKTLLVLDDGRELSVAHSRLLNQDVIVQRQS